MKPLALMADIECMFYQVRVDEGDRDFLRFLWWSDGDYSKEPDVFRMKVHLFEGTWSPSCCSFALRKTALDHESEYDSSVISSAMNEFYVDDFLKSVNDDESGIAIANKVTELLSKGGFVLRKWRSNSQSVMDAMPIGMKVNESKPVELDYGSVAYERTLGVLWNVMNDCFEFKIKICDKPLTKRGILSMVSSVYDPYGFLCPFLLLAKKLIQDLTVRKLEWDENLSENELIRWMNWKNDLVNLQDFKVTRCAISKALTNIKVYELHHFAVASDIAYGTASYLRQFRLSGTIGHLSNDDPEIRRNAVMSVALVKQNSVDKLMNYYSDWIKLKRAVAWVLLFCMKIDKNERKCLNVEDLERSERAIIRFVQSKEFELEIIALKYKHFIKRKSRLRGLDPFLDKNGLLRVGGRLSQSSLEFETMCPLILPKGGHITNFVIRYYHELHGHAGKNYVLAEIRGKFWIINGNSTVGKVLNKCVHCRRYSSKHSEQKMSDLPVDRVTDGPAFTCVGVDYFGPFFVKNGRKQVKRYGVIFTCLSSRAVHIETATSLDTDSFMNALHRFTARRGPVKVLRSDNGTNFVGAERELSQYISNFNDQRFQDKLINKGITWMFNTQRQAIMVECGRD
ncbi:hypothetical protein GQR58_012950 [Nymphon striatum]|nr:hypothetical protein GQR58_012950 [Nymphon striatum]